MTATVERIIEEVNTLTAEERQQVAAVLGFGPPSEPLESTVEKERRLAERLLAIGMIDHIPAGYPEGYIEPPPIIVQGEPVSETIIRERR